MSEKKSSDKIAALRTILRASSPVKNAATDADRRIAVPIIIKINLILILSLTTQ